MKTRIITFLLLTGMTGVCLAQGMGAAPPQDTNGVNNINSDNAQDNSTTGAQGNVENSTY